MSAEDRKYVLLMTDGGTRYITMPTGWYWHWQVIETGARYHVSVYDQNGAMQGFIPSVKQFASDELMFTDKKDNGAT